MVTALWARFGGPALPHTFVLCVCLGMLSVGLILQQPGPDHTRLSLAGLPLPPMCMLKRSTGLDCPGCGLTRAFVAASQGDLAASFGWHRLGWLAVLYTILQGIRHGLWLFWERGRTRVDRLGTYLDRALAGIVLLLPINWLASLLGF